MSNSSAADRMGRPAPPARIIAVGGGKGGVGKSVLSIVLASASAARGSRVVLVDLDLGSANLHTYLGLHGDMPGIADFFLKKATDLEELAIETPIQNVKLVSGARFYPGIANPPHQTKLKLIRHMRKLAADVVILDLGAGVHFNTLDFFSVSQPGLITLAPEPGSVLNAYSFVKAGLFRHLLRVFGKDPDVRAVLDEAGQRGGEESFTLESFQEAVRALDPSFELAMEELTSVLRPALVMNQVTDMVSAVYADNLQKLVLKKLGLRVRYLGNLPRIEGLSERLVGLPAHLVTKDGSRLVDAATALLDDIEAEYPLSPSTTAPAPAAGGRIREDFLEDELEVISALLGKLDVAALGNTRRAAWKLRLYYRPGEVVNLLIQNGISHPLMFEE